MKRIFSIPILFFIAFALFFYVVLPKMEISNREKTKFFKAEQSVKNRMQYFADLKTTLLEIESYREAISNVEVSLSGEISLADLIGFFSQKASNNGLTLKSVIPIQATISDDALKSPTRANFQSFGISLSGGINSLETFLKDVETSARLVEVESISLQNQDEKGLLEINVQVNVYY